ncbi:MAG TPA: sialidase family protein, partial [Pirellulales bacterium]|nr:sialidase family protein [Pirellulales bacterium]
MRTFRFDVAITILIAMVTCHFGDRASAAEPLFETTVVFPVAPHNKPNYRIPAILQTPGGDILVFAEKRNDGPGDIGNHDVVMKRSTDLGSTWSDEHVLFDGGDLSNVDITVGIDRDLNAIWLFFLRDKKQFVAMHSVDEGRIWSGPTSIHEQVTRPDWDSLKSKSSSGSADPSSGGRGAQWAADWDQR